MPMKTGISFTYKELMRVVTIYTKLTVKRLTGSFQILCKRQGYDFSFTRCTHDFNGSLAMNI